MLELLSVAECNRCHGRTLTTSDVITGTHGNVRIDPNLPSGWDINPNAKDPHYFLCNNCKNIHRNGYPSPRDDKSNDPIIAQGIIDTIKFSLNSPEDIISAVKALISLLDQK